VAELVDALGLGSSVFNVEVQVLSAILGKESKRSMGTERRYRTCLTIWPGSIKLA
jgi:hypothetical protein